MGTNRYFWSTRLRQLSARPLLLWLLLALPAVVQAQYSSTTADGQVTITGYTGSDTVLTLPATIDGLPVTRIGDNAFNGRTGLTGVTIGNSVTRIGDRAFASCTGLTGVTLPNSVTHIGGGAFYGCTGLIVVTIPASVNSIGNEAFRYCTRLQGVYFHGNAPSLGGGVFSGANVATVYYLPGATGWNSTFGDRPTVLQPYTYTIADGQVTITGYTGSDTVLTLPAIIDGLPVTRIGDNAFNGLTGLTGVILPDSVTRIGANAFQGCTGLQGILFQGNVPSLGALAFDGVTATVAYLQGTTGWQATFGGLTTAEQVQYTHTIAGTAYTPLHGKEGLGLGAAGLWRGCSGPGSAGSAEGSVPI